MKTLIVKSFKTHESLTEKTHFLLFIVDYPKIVYIFATVNRVEPVYAGQFYFTKKTR